MSDNRASLSYTVSVEKVYTDKGTSTRPMYKVCDNAMSPTLLLCTLYTTRTEEMEGFLNGRYGIRSLNVQDIPEPPAKMVWTIHIVLGYGQPVATLLPDDLTLAPAEVKGNVVAVHEGMDVVLEFVKAVGHTRLGSYWRDPTYTTRWRMSGHEFLCDLLACRTDLMGWTWDMRDDSDVLVDAAGQDRFTVAR